MRDGAKVAVLLEDLGITEGRIAVALNSQIVPRAEHAAARSAECDKVAIVTFVDAGVGTAGPMEGRIEETPREAGDVAPRRGW